MLLPVEVAVAAVAPAAIEIATTSASVTAAKVEAVAMSAICRRKLHDITDNPIRNSIRRIGSETHHATRTPTIMQAPHPCHHLRRRTTLLRATAAAAALANATGPRRAIPIPLPPLRLHR
jgi:hypothetical protein